MFIFEFPQNIIGYIGFIIYAKLLSHPYYKYKDAYVIHIRGGWGAISLSKYIFADDYCYNSNIIMHEYGHRKQSQLLLFLYVFIIGIPSITWNYLFRRYRVRNNISYYWFFTESWANKLGGYDS